MATKDSSRKSIGTGILCALGVLFFLLTVPNGAWSEKTGGKAALLGDTHKAAGIECAQCHKEKPSSPVPTAVCASCHAEIANPTAAPSKKRNPHDAHMPFPDCASCHHAHKPSENQCNVCHDFNFKTP